MTLNKTKKILIGFVSTILGLFLLLLLIPVIFEDEIADYVKKEANMRLKGTLEFKDVDISMFRNFPRISVTLGDVSIVGEKEFATDTLLSAGELGVTVNLMSVFSGDFEISKVKIENTRVNTIIGKSGAVNWDIVKSEEELKEEGYSEEDSEIPFTLELEEIEINNLSVTYDDRDANMFLALEAFNAVCSGNLQGDITTLKIEGSSPSLTYTMMGLPIMRDVAIKADMDIEFDMAQSKITFRDNNINLNAVQTSIDGWLAMLEEGFDMDIRLNTEKVGFKELLSLFPGLYTDEFAAIKTSGKAMMSAYAKGIFDEQQIPAFDVLLSVSEAYFQYPNLPAGIDNINIVANVTNPGGSVDATVIKLKPCYMQIAGQALSLAANISTPISDLAFDIAVDGVIDFEKLSDAFPVGETAINGMMTADLQLNGRASYLLSGQMDKCNAAGSVQLKDFEYTSADMPKITIPSSTFSFTPAALKLNNTVINAGQSDVTLSASLENYLGYLFADSTIKGKLNINSNMLNLNEFMATSATDSTEADTATTETTLPTATLAKGEAIQVPTNIDFDMQVNAKKIIYGSAALNNVAGTLKIKDGKIDMSNLSTNAMGGGITVNGSYSTSSDYNALFDAGIYIKDLKVASIAQDLGLSSQILSMLTGSVSSHFDVNAPLNGTTPDLGALSASGSFSIKDLGLPQIEMLSTIADLIGDSKLKNPKFEDFDIGFELKEGVVYTKPIEIVVSGYTINLNGTAKLDMSIDYQGTLTMPKSAGKLAEMGPISFTIGGTLTDPKPTVDFEKIAKSAAQQLFSGALFGSNDGNSEGDAEQKALPAEAEKIVETVTKVDSTISNVKQAIDNLPTKEEVVEQIKEQLPTEEEIKEEVTERLENAAKDFLGNLMNKSKNKTESDK
ncbi:MAG: AsmA family protein [Alistipes sp.]|nr:AsmA family protein [Alistipes sp.]